MDKAPAFEAGEYMFDPCQGQSIFFPKVIETIWLEWTSLFNFNL